MSEDADALFVFIPETDGGPGREPALLFETPGEMKTSPMIRSHWSIRTGFVRTAWRWKR